MTDVDLIAKRATDEIYKSVIDTLREFADNPAVMDLGGPAALRHAADAFEKAIKIANA
jgi:hypothetical protein